MDEVNPMAEMGFMHDKQIIIEPQGFLTPSNPVRDLAVEFIPNGGKIYDLLDRYDDVVTYILNRDDVNNNSDSSKLLAPFLKAFGVTDYEARKYYDENIQMMKGAAEVMDYFTNTMPVLIDAKCYEHAAHALCEKIGVPIPIVSASFLDLDNTTMPMKACRELRAMAAEIEALKISTVQYELNVPSTLDEDESRMITTLDDIFLKRLQGTEAADMIQNMVTVGPNEKAYSLLDMRKSTQVDLDGTIYIGGEIIDFQAMDLIKDGNGLSMAFNGSEIAVHGCNVAVISDDCIVAAVLVAKFYSTGIQGVFDLIDNWNREYLETTDFPDRNLLDEMLRRHPDNLPEVYHVTRYNVDEIAVKSESFRESLFNKYAGKSTKKVE
ncbi:MAG: hypothetical protein MJZ21_03875 [archaeon]|nr:hypothetical protein [archaeon]